MKTEKRRRPRIILNRQVLLNNAIGVMGLDLSEGGIYIHTGRHFAAGSEVSVHLPLGGIALDLTARVQHSNPGIGMGLMFGPMTPDQKRTLSTFILKHMRGAQGRKKVLIVDENSGNSRVYRSKLVLDGFTVFEAGDCGAAQDLIGREPVDLVLVDLYQGGINTLDTIRLIRAAPGIGAETPVLVVSAQASQADMENARKAGATEFMARMTTSPARLSERVKLHLNG